MSYTVSFHHGTEYVRDHNRRSEKLHEAHIDPNGVHENWTDETIGQAYKDVFSEAVAEYNSKQKRADRKIKSYLQKVRENSKLNECYEFIAQVGNEKQHPDEKLSKKILKKYIEDFKKRNPNLYVFGAYYHADELAQTPHIHVDYIPIAKGKKTGLKIRNNLRSALEELGYETEFVEQDKAPNPDTKKPSKKLYSAEMKFQEAERKALIEICQSFGLEIVQPNRSPDENMSSKELRRVRDIRIQNMQKEKELKAREKAQLQKEAEAVDFVRKRQNQIPDKLAVKDFEKTAFGSPEKLEQNYPIKKNENIFQYACRIVKTIWNGLKEQIEKINDVVATLKTANTDLLKQNKRLSDEVDKVVDERLKSRSTALLQPLTDLNKTYKSVLFEKNEYKTDRGIKFTAKNGLLDYSKKVTDKLYEFSNMTPEQFKKQYEKTHDEGMSFAD